MDQNTRRDGGEEHCIAQILPDQSLVWRVYSSGACVAFCGGLQGVPEVPALDADALALIESLKTRFSEADAKEVKEIESVTNHDVKAVEYFLRAKVGAASGESVSRSRSLCCDLGPAAV